MTTFITFLILVFVILAMCIGLFFGKKPITGSCGGLANLEPGRECEICGGNPSKCIEQ
ncbi:MAG: ApbE family protein [Gammaproteobacteria bacterium]|nr:ApbE family protein [Gammaproteobacteria bacterium]